MSADYTLFDGLAADLGCPCLKEEPLSRHTTFRIGGPADRFVTAETVSQLQALLGCFRETGLPWLLLGNGSDLLAADEGFRGVALALGGELKEIRAEEGGCIRAGAGASLASVCAFARERGLSGLEFAWGIPGTVGGGVYMDAGAYGGEMKDVVESAAHMTPEGEVEVLSGPELEFSYRRSRYCATRDVILWARLKLEPGDPALIGEKMEELMNRRKEKQPYDLPSAGSVFKRPPNGFAAALIEECGLKGRAVGGAQVSPKHSGFIVNNGGATCKDVLALIQLIQDEVFRQKGVILECEVKLIGQ